MITADPSTPLRVNFKPHLEKLEERSEK